MSGPGGAGFGICRAPPCFPGISSCTTRLIRPATSRCAPRGALCVYWGNAGIDRLWSRKARSTRSRGCWAPTCRPYRIRICERVNGCVSSGARSRMSRAFYSVSNRTRVSWLFPSISSSGAWRWRWIARWWYPLRRLGNRPRASRSLYPPRHGQVHAPKESGLVKPPVVNALSAASSQIITPCYSGKNRRIAPISLSAHFINTLTNPFALILRDGAKTPRLQEPGGPSRRTCPEASRKIEGPVTSTGSVRSLSASKGAESGIRFSRRIRRILMRQSALQGVTLTRLHKDRPPVMELANARTTTAIVGVDRRDCGKPS